MRTWAPAPREVADERRVDGGEAGSSVALDGYLVGRGDREVVGDAPGVTGRECCPVDEVNAIELSSGA